MPIGVEAAYKFGDIVFNIPLIRAIHTHLWKTRYKDDVWVATIPPYQDALYNIPWVHKIIDISNMGEGITKLRELGCDPVFQVTQHAKFTEFHFNDPAISLIDTPAMTGRQLGLPEFDQRPIFLPTQFEISSTDSLVSQQPTIGIESVYTSWQSWADDKAFAAIVAKYINTHRILWLSNSGAPEHPQIDNLLRFSRRQAIMCLRACDIFFSVGSGFFCASLALPSHWQPKKIVCLWQIDPIAKYEKPIARHKWHNDITWLHNETELQQFLATG
jgi:hypothetical protein